MSTFSGKIVFFAADPNKATRLDDIGEHEYRDKFQRDRDRILYSKEFRRLSGKTQVFIAGYDDNMRTRLTHTLEVSQIAVTIAKRLGLNESLTEAIALGHDLGHTPFGHVGERTLNYIMNGCFPYYGFNTDLASEEKGFKHNLQGVRVASFLEDSINPEKHGLNLTKYTLWGIANHSSPKYKECEYCRNHKKCRYKNCDKDCPGTLSVGFFDQYLRIFDESTDWTFEAVIVAYADEIAQRHHDIEDGIYAGVINQKNLCDYITGENRFDQAFRDRISKLLTEISNSSHAQDCSNEETSRSAFIRNISRIIIDYYVTSYSETLSNVVTNLKDSLGISDECDCDDWKKAIYEYVQRQNCTIVDYFGFSKNMKDADKSFGQYLSHHILYSELAQSMDGKASYIIRQLFKAYLTNPQQLPDKTIMSIVQNWCDKNSVQRLNPKTHMTNESSARDKLKELITKDDADIRCLLIRRVCDFIAGMTDQYALKCFSQLYESNAIFK